MANKQLRLILDDNAGNITYGGGQWTLSTLVQWYQGTSNFPAFAQVSDTFGSLSLSFEGTQIVFIGNTPPQGLSQSASVSIDGAASYNMTYGSSTPPAYVQWYQSPTLADGKHTITIGQLDGTALDMAIITVGPNTPLAGNKVFVDNNDPALQYSGSWAESTGGFNAGTLPDGLPIGNSTQRTTTVGDTMTFRFAGTSISVYGIFSWSNIGSISAAYALDGVVSSQTYPVTSGSAQHVSGDGQASNFLFFDKENLSSGPHTLVLNVTDVENQEFILDYLVYTPSFSSLATMPDLTSPTTTAPTSVNVPANPDSTISTQTSSTQPAVVDTQGNNAAKSTPVGAIVGGVIGGVLVSVLAILLFWYLRKRQSRETQSLSVEQRLVANANLVVPLPHMSGLSATPPSYGHSASSSDATPFLTATTPVGFATISDLKRDRYEHVHTGSSPFSSDTMSNTTSFDNSQRNVSTMASPSTAQTGNTEELEYTGSDSVPPAYDALSTNRPSLSPVRR